MNSGVVGYVMYLLLGVCHLYKVIHYFGTAIIGWTLESDESRVLVRRA